MVRPGAAAVLTDLEPGPRFGDTGPAVAALQRALLRLGYYGVRFALDGIYGPNTLGAILACKHDLVTVYGQRRGPLAYAPADRDRRSQTTSGRVTPAFADAVRALLAGEALGGVPAWRLPSRAEVADAGLDVRAALAAEAQRPAFPVHLLWEILAVESGASHFDHHGYVKFGVDWRGRTYAQTVTFTPEAASAPWVRSRGWGLAQYTPPGGALPRPMPDYILSVAANLRTAVALFRRKFETVTARRPCSYPSQAAPAYQCPLCLRSRLPDPAAYSAAAQQPCSWLLAAWAYNGMAPAGRKYMERVARNLVEKA